jgi:pimeloyl-ACP methyl ester carboxylesterase
MQPIHFGVEGRRLFGVFHARAAGTPPRSAVLLCNAFGREGVQLHRMFRVVADRLSRTGCDVLRFDYYGTGDSDGDDGDANLDGWTQDILTAHAELAKCVAAAQVTWIGARVGATLLQRAAERVMPARLVMLDPVFDGRDYLDLLRLHHWHTLIETQRPRQPPGAIFREEPNFYIEEASGFAIPRAFCDQLRAIRFTPAAPAADNVVACDVNTSNGRQLADACAPLAGAIRLVNFSHGEDWTSSLAPAPVVNLLVAEAGRNA